MTDNSLRELIAFAQSKHVVCIGDIMLDKFVYGEVGRISPEAPVPVLRHTKTLSMPGGAGNVARNLVSLGMRCTLVGVQGDDPDGDELRSAFSGIELALAVATNRGTVVKTRFVSGGQQLLRVDVESPVAYAPSVMEDLTAKALSAIKHADLLILSDYAKGALTEALVTACIAQAQTCGVPVIVDPKSDDLLKYRGADVIKPNASELGNCVGMPADNDTDIEAALAKAMAIGAAQTIVVTRAAKGMSFISADGKVSHKKGTARDVFDVSGAGDTSISAMALGLVGGGSVSEAVDLAILASGLAVGKAGTAVVTSDELIAQVSGDSRTLIRADFNRKANVAKAHAWHDDGYRVGFTNGCFDILHPGHLKVLEEARAHCGKLVVGLNSDASVRRLKGASRPVNDEISRAIVLMGLASVDAVVIFDEDTPLELITALQPDLLVKGGDYTKDEIVGADVVEARGGRVHIVPLVEGHSTTATIARADR
ncbi:MAG: D-glycero-beta-D-manno-heptose 1-phosphate adenylyltransferase [Hyphomonas sp.]